MTERTGTLTVRLARAGFQDASHAEQILTDLGVAADDAVVGSLFPAADPDLAVRSLAAMAAAMPHSQREEFIA
ncbi:MAG: hypothetical protein JO246_16710, partial [Frankiaceae bacterium]|nr:hypothetical protein [Frankiaceae bacterium]